MAVSLPRARPEARTTGAWWVVLAGVTAALHIGKLPPAIPALQLGLNVSLIEAGFLLSLVQVAGMTLGLLVGLSADRWGLKRSVITGLALLSAGSLLGGLAHHVAVLLALRVVEGLGFLLVALPAPGLIRQLANPSRLNLMIGVWGTYMPFGTAVALLLGPWVIQHIEWQGWWWALGVWTLLVSAGLVYCLPRTAASAEVATQAHGQWRARLQQTLSSRAPWVLALMFFAYSGQWLAVVGFLPTVLSDAGFSGWHVAIATAGVAVVNVAGNLVAGFLIHRGVSPARLLRVGFISMAFASWLAYSPVIGGDNASQSVGLRILAVAAFSAVGGMIPTTLFALAVRVGPQSGSIATTLGWMQQWSAFGQFVGPPVVAAFAHAVGGWQWTWVATGVMALMGAALSTALRAEPKV